MKSSASNMLNQGLYNLLKQQFGKVLTRNAGERGTIWYERGIDGISRPRITGGEYYSVCCPYCGDNRFRLWIHYLYGQDDPKAGQAMWHLAVCYNERCDMGMLGELVAGIPYQRVEVNHSNVEPELVYEDPGTVLPLRGLPDDHPALTYLRRRGYDPSWLDRFFGFGYAMNTDFRWTDRIWFPVIHGGKYVGWQTRAIDDRFPKYYTMHGFRKSRTLWPYDQLMAYHGQKQMKLLILVEGVFDALRLWPYAACCFGHDLSTEQAKLVGNLSYNGTTLLGFDPDAIGRPHEILTDEELKVLTPESRQYLYEQAAIVKKEYPLTNVNNTWYNVRRREFLDRRSKCRHRLLGSTANVGILDLPLTCKDPDEIPNDQVASVIASSWSKCNG